MTKAPSTKVQKSYMDGYVKVRVDSSAHGRGNDISASVSVDLTLEAARTFEAELHAAIFKAEEKMKAKAESAARRKTWRDREVAAGRMKIINF